MRNLIFVKEKFPKICFAAIKEKKKPRIVLQHVSGLLLFGIIKRMDELLQQSFGKLVKISSSESKYDMIKHKKKL